MALREGKITRPKSVIVVSLFGGNKMLQSLDKYDNETRKVIGKFFNKMLTEIRKSIRKEAPVKTGLLRRSIKILENKKRKREFVGIIGPDGSAVNRQGKHYVPLIVFGTDRNRPNNFIFRGFNKSLRKIFALEKAMGKEVRKAIKKSRIR